MAKRRKKFTLYVLNIKLISNHRKGDEAYRRILEDIFANSLQAKTNSGKKVILRTMYPAESEGQKFFYGKISRFTDLENQDWIDISTKEVTNPELDPNLFPNLQETEYVWVPQAHRFIVVKSPQFTIKNAADFFNSVLEDVLASDEDFSVSIEQSEDIYDEIYKALRVERLMISISYTNSDDIGIDADQWMDDELRDSNASQATFYFKATPNESISLDKTLIKGAMGLARENGEVEATIKDQDSRRRKIITKQHPKELRDSSENEESIKDVIFNMIMKIYRGGKE